MSAKCAPFLNKSHNFGIFLKKGKRGILQLDFPSQMLLMIQRGHIKKTQPFSSLLYFESEEDLYISLRFLDGELEFEADTLEEKYTICRLLDLLLETENSDSGKMLAAAAASGGVCVLPRIPLVPHNVLKDGVLEKKGNTPITTWNRRRVKVSAGELAYFKPGEELALNVVHLRHDRCVIQRVGQNTLQLSVNQRLYCFRVPNDSRSGLSVETIRDDWIKAFEQAMTMKRAVSALYPSSLLPPEEEDPGHHGDTETTSDVSSADGSPFVSRKTSSEPFTHSLDTGKPEITASVSVHFSYNNNSNNSQSSIDPTTTTFVNQQPPQAAKRTVYPFRRQDRGSERGHGSSSDIVSRPHPDSLSDDLPVTALRAKFTAHTTSHPDAPLTTTTPDIAHGRSASVKESKAQKLNDRVLAFSDLSLGDSDPKILAKRQLPDPPLPQSPTSDPPGVVQLQSKKYGKERPSVLDMWKDKEQRGVEEKNPSVLQLWADREQRTGEEKSPSVLQLWADREKGKNSFGRHDSTLVDLSQQSFRDDSVVHQTFSDDTVVQSKAPPAGHKVTTEGKAGGPGGKKGLWKASSMSDLLDVKTDPDKDVMVPKPQSPTLPPPPSTIPPAPSLLPPPAPSLAPPLSVVRGVGGKGAKLKQVHWTPVDKKLISASLWSGKAWSVPTFDLEVLEAMFSVSKREGSVVNKGRAVAQSLVDGKRAQNLGILFSGFRAGSVGEVVQALASVTEPPSFQMQKMTALKRFQPTAEDVELFRMYCQSRDRLTPVDRFMLDLSQIPKLSMRIDLVLALWDFPNNYHALAEEVEDLLSGCELLLSSERLPAVLHCLLNIGNHLNAARQPRAVPGFQISSIDKMVDVKGRDPAYSLMTYLVDQVHRHRPDLLDWTASLSHLPTLAGYSVRAIGAEIDVLKNDLQKVKKYQKALKGLSGVQKKFQSDVQNFVLENEKRMQTLHDQNDRLKHRFQQLLAWLGEPPTRTSDVLFSSLALLIDRFNTARTRLAP